MRSDEKRQVVIDVILNNQKNFEQPQFATFPPQYCNIDPISLPSVTFERNIPSRPTHVLVLWSEKKTRHSKLFHLATYHPVIRLASCRGQVRQSGNVPTRSSECVIINSNYWKPAFRRLLLLELPHCWAQIAGRFITFVRNSSIFFLLLLLLQFCAS